MTRFVPLWLLAAMLVVGCGKSDPSDAANFGRFEGRVVAHWEDDGRHMTLQEDFAYVDAADRKWVAPAGTKVDGASIPSAFWSIIGGPFEGQYRNASVVHDIECVEMRAPWEDVHRMFYEACRCGGVDDAKAKVMYYAVYHFGPRWKLVRDTEIQVRETSDGRLIEEEVEVQKVCRIDPPPPTPEEVEEVAAYVAAEDPAPETMKKFDRASLQQRYRGRSGGRSGGGHARTMPDGQPRPERYAEGYGRQHSHGEGSTGRPGPWRDDAQFPRPERTERAERPERSFDGERTANGQRPEGAEHPAGGRGEWNSRGPHGGHPGQRQWPVGLEDGAPRNGGGYALSPEEQQQAIEVVQRYIAEQTGEARPADFTVRRTRGGVQVSVQFVREEEDRREPIEGATATARVSRQGEVVEFVSGGPSASNRD